MQKLREIVAVVAFAALIAVFCLLVTQAGDRGADNERELVRSAVKNAALTCYAVEGAYPEELDYLRENYGLAYNTEVYVVHYDAFASNIMPDIQVSERGRQQ